MCACNMCRPSLLQSVETRGCLRSAADSPLPPTFHLHVQQLAALRKLTWLVLGEDPAACSLTQLDICCLRYWGKEGTASSQRSLHNAPIFRLLLKVAVNGTHQCDFLNFCGDLGPQLCDMYGHPVGHIYQADYARTHKDTRCGQKPVWQSPPKFVFVFTLDCNNRIYCYDTEDVLCAAADWLKV